MLVVYAANFVSFIDIKFLIFLYSFKLIDFIYLVIKITMK